MSLYKEFKNNEKAETDGIWIDIPDAPNKDGSIPGFLLARAGGSNRAYSKSLDNKTRAYRRRTGNLDNLNPEIAEKILIEVFADSVLRNWRNVPDENESFMEFNQQNAKKLLSDLPELFSRLQEESKSISNYHAQALEQEAKN